MRFTVPKHLQVMVAGDAKPDGMAVMKPDSSALEVRGLTKRFDRLAVDGLECLPLRFVHGTSHPTQEKSCIAAGDSDCAT